MAGAIKKYLITKNKLSKACLKGFTVEENGVLCTEADEMHHSAFLLRIDGGTESCEWGRVSLKIKTGLEMVFVLRAFASNDNNFIAEQKAENIQAFLLDEKRPISQKYQLFDVAGSVKSTGYQDVLLYGQTGRYLYLALEILGEGIATISDICVWVPGDNFYNTFPEVYRTEGEFFCRYLTVFSSIYNDMQEKIDNIEKVLEVENAPRNLLLVFANWLGIAPPENLLRTEQLRALVRMAHLLIQEKGTLQTIEKVMEILTDDKAVYIVENTNERFLAQGGPTEHGAAPYSITILVNRVAEERLNARIRYLVGQFVPLRCDVDIVFIGDRHAFDSYCCLDINASIEMPKNGNLDEKTTLNGMSQLC